MLYMKTWLSLCKLRNECQTFYIGYSISVERLSVSANQELGHIELKCVHIEPKRVQYAQKRGRLGEAS